MQSLEGMSLAVMVVVFCRDTASCGMPDVVAQADARNAVDEIELPVRKV
jgi:hypothetical protein